MLQVLSLLKAQIRMMQRCISYEESLASYMYASVHQSEGAKDVANAELKVNSYDNRIEGKTLETHMTYVLPFKS